MRLNTEVHTDSGLARQITGAEMFRPLAFIAIAALTLFADQAAAGPSETTGAGDAAKIYAAFLDGWTGEEKNPINVAIVADAPNAEALNEFSDCADKPHWMPVEPIDDLTGLIGKLAYVRLVDPGTWRSRDPAELIAKGATIESAVDSGFDNGLATFSAIVFDASHTTAAFTFSFVCGRLCGSGRTVIYKLTPAGWVESDKQCGHWISRAQGGRPGNSFTPRPNRYDINPRVGVAGPA
ncbi:hypothetical protein [Pseudoxanthomonas gei]|uniref:hypothetical protein n=1 Tax=Pseudoxanthomonas gei TaxID=1383030 RepID=UPI00139142DA|nr:hypothetical protein [Pseudoxanthomonas gei]